MSTQYPNAIDQFPVHQDNANEKITAAHINDIQDAIVAIEQTVGTTTNGLTSKVSTIQTMMVMGGF